MMMTSERSPSSPFSRRLWANARQYIASSLFSGGSVTAYFAARSAASMGKNCRSVAVPKRMLIGTKTTSQSSLMIVWDQ